MARVALVSFRLGGTDGVAIEAAKWAGALRGLGHQVTTVAGEGCVDVTVEGLGLAPTRPPSRDDLERALSNQDLVIVENVASLPLNVPARDVLYEVLATRPALFHHHDLAWQRAHLAHLEGPRDSPHWRHVVINELSRQQLLERGITATLLYNSFDVSPPPGRRAETRRALGVADQRLVLLPTRALARKNVEGALTLASHLDATLWILGPSEDGYEEELATHLRATSVPVRRGLPSPHTIHDAYAAADLVVMPSTWEGFGNPVLESVTHRRPLALAPYPVAREITSFGFRFFGLDEYAALARFLDAPNEELFEANLALARSHFNLAHLPERLRALLDEFELPS